MEENNARNIFGNYGIRREEDFTIAPTVLLVVVNAGINETLSNCG